MAYNLVDGMGLGAYSYPRLMGLTHYGDWQAQFEAGTLVYYEVYSDGSYGFRGANKSTVKTTGTVVGDGYGMVYSTPPEQDLTVRYSLGGPGGHLYPVPCQRHRHGRGRYLLPLPRTLVNTTEVSTDLPPGAGGGHHLLLQSPFHLLGIGGLRGPGGPQRDRHPHGPAAE